MKNKQQQKQLCWLKDWDWTQFFGGKKKTGVIYLSAVVHVYIPPWAIPSTIEMVPPASSVSISSPELDHVP